MGMSTNRQLKLDLLTLQSGKCAVCLHETNADECILDYDGKDVRGCLCPSCNSALVHLGGSLENVIRMKKYFLSPPSRYLSSIIKQATGLYKGDTFYNIRERM